MGDRAVTKKHGFRSSVILEAAPGRRSGAASGSAGHNNITGWLSKKSTRGFWQKRWFKLTKHHLVYYKYVDAPVPHADIDLRLVEAVTVVNTSGELSLLLVNGDALVDYRLRAPSADAAGEWASWIRDHVERAEPLERDDAVQPSLAAGAAAARPSELSAAGDFSFSNPMAAAQEAAAAGMKGWLQKESPSEWHKYQTRWCEIDPSRGQLSYWKDDAAAEKGKQPSGVIALDSMEWVRPAAHGPADKRLESDFDLKCGHRVYRWRARAATERDDWCKALTAAGQAARAASARHARVNALIENADSDDGDGDDPAAAAAASAADLGDSEELTRLLEAPDVGVAIGDAVAHIFEEAAEPPARDLGDGAAEAEPEEDDDGILAALRGGDACLAWLSHLFKLCETMSPPPRDTVWRCVYASHWRINTAVRTFLDDDDYLENLPKPELYSTIGWLSKYFKELAALTQPFSPEQRAALLEAHTGGAGSSMLDDVALLSERYTRGEGGMAEQLWEFCANALKAQSEDRAKAYELDPTGERGLLTFLPHDIWQCIQHHLALAQGTEWESLQYMTVDAILSVLQKLVPELQAEMLAAERLVLGNAAAAAAHEDVHHDPDSEDEYEAPPHIEPYLCALINDCVLHVDQLEELISELGISEAMFARLRKKHSKVMRLLVGCEETGYACLSRLVARDVQPLIKEAFNTEAWLNGDAQPIATVAATCADYLADYQPSLDPYCFGKVVALMQLGVVKLYLGTLDECAAHRMGGLPDDMHGAAAAAARDAGHAFAARVASDAGTLRAAFEEHDLHPGADAVVVLDQLAHLFRAEMDEVAHMLLHMLQAQQPVENWLRRGIESAALAVLGMRCGSRDEWKDQAEMLDMCAAGVQRVPAETEGSKKDTAVLSKVGSNAAFRSLAQKPPETRRAAERPRARKKSSGHAVAGGSPGRPAAAAAAAASGSSKAKSMFKSVARMMHITKEAETHHDEDDHDEEVAQHLFDESARASVEQRFSGGSAMLGGARTSEIERELGLNDDLEAEREPSVGGWIGTVDAQTFGDKLRHQEQQQDEAQSRSSIIGGSGERASVSGGARVSFAAGEEPPAAGGDQPLVLSTMTVVKMAMLAKLSPKRVWQNRWFVLRRTAPKPAAPGLPPSLGMWVLSWHKTALDPIKGYLVITPDMFDLYVKNSPEPLAQDDADGTWHREYDPDASGAGLHGDAVFAVAGIKETGGTRELHLKAKDVDDMIAWLDALAPLHSGVDEPGGAGDDGPNDHRSSAVLLGLEDDRIRGEQLPRTCQVGGGDCVVS